MVSVSIIVRAISKRDAERQAKTIIDKHNVLLKQHSWLGFRQRKITTIRKYKSEDLYSIHTIDK